MDISTIKVIGIGGIGGCLLPVLCKFLNYRQNKGRVEIVLVDGDAYEFKNAERQFFTEMGNKAEVSVKRLKQDKDLTNLDFDFVPEFVSRTNIDLTIREGDIVFLCVDKHSVRKLVSERCEELSNVVLISGGNEFTDGNIQVFVRENGTDITLPLTNYRHPEIADPEDRNPAEMGCERLIETGEPQLVIMNNMIAAMMLNCFYAWIIGSLNYIEVYADIITSNCRPVGIEEAKEAMPV